MMGEGGGGRKSEEEPGGARRSERARARVTQHVLVLALAQRERATRLRVL